MIKPQSKLVTKQAQGRDIRIKKSKNQAELSARRKAAVLSVTNSDYYTEDKAAKHHSTTLAIPEVAFSLQGQHLQVPAKPPGHSRHGSSSGLNQYSNSSSVVSSKRGLSSSNSTSIGAGSIAAKKSPPHYIPDTKVSRIFFQMRNSVLKRTGVNLVSEKSQRLKKKEVDALSHGGGSEQVRIST